MTDKALQKLLPTDPLPWEIEKWLTTIHAHATVIADPGHDDIKLTADCIKKNVNEDLRPAIIAAFEAKDGETQKNVYAPGRWRCPKCNFVLIQANLNAADGTVTARDKPGDKCPNCQGPMWRVSWKQEAEENLGIAEKAIADCRAVERAFRTFLIWSTEHGAWWRPGSRGYTNKASEAGRWLHDEAMEICRDARNGAKDDYISEIPVPESMIKAMLEGKIG